MRLLVILALLLGLAACSAVTDPGPEQDGGIGGTGILAGEVLE